MRGAAIALVICNHMGIRVRLSATALGDIFPRWLLTGLNFNGSEAVTIFFVLSGFLITSRAIDQYGALDRVPPISFVLYRAARILPCLLALLAVIGGLGWIGLPDYQFTKPGQSFQGAALAALGLYFNVWQARHGWSVAGLTVLWSLSIEALFYLAFPFLGHLKRVFFLTVMGALALSVPFYHATLTGNEIWYDQATLTGLGTIAAGVITAIIAKHYRLPPLCCVILGASDLVLTGAELFVGGYFWPRFGEVMLADLIIGTCLLALACHWMPTAGKSWTWPLRRLGQLSYEIYLIHMFVVITLIQLFRSAGWGLAQGWVLYPVCFGLVWILAEGVSRGYSRPAARYFDRKIPPLRSRSEAEHMVQ